MIRKLYHRVVDAIIRRRYRRLYRRLFWYYSAKEADPEVAIYNANMAFEWLTMYRWEEQARDFLPYVPPRKRKWGDQALTHEASS